MSRSASVIPRVKSPQGQTLGPLPVTGDSPPESRTSSQGFKQTPACVRVDGWVTLAPAAVSPCISTLF